MSDKPGDDGDAQLARMQAEYDKIMRAFDQVVGQSGDVEDELDPELERELQRALQGYLAQVPPPGLTQAEIDDPERFRAALEAHVKPLFDILFATSTVHARAAAEALRAGRDASRRSTSPTATLDLSGILEEDDQ
jgi:hypothetical protein